MTVDLGDSTRHEQPADQAEILVLAPRECGPNVSRPFFPLDRERAAALLGALAVVGLSVTTAVSSWRPAPPAVAVAVLPAPVARVQPSVPNPYDALKLEAQAVVVYDVRAKQVLYARDAETPRPLASLTKLMTSLVAAESLSGGSRVAVSQNAVDTEGDSGLLANETWSLRDLIGFTLMTSSNDGADAVAAAAGALYTTTPSTTPEYERVDSFVAQMNTRARELGLTTTMFKNATGLDTSPGVAGAQGSAKDVASLMSYLAQERADLLAPTTKQRTMFTSEDGFEHPAINTNEHVPEIPGLIGSKTGYTELAGGNLAIVYDAGLDHPIAVVVLGSTREGRFTDVRQLVDATYDLVATGWYAYLYAGSTEVQLTNRIYNGKIKSDK